jgi:hypothetical protein
LPRCRWRTCARHIVKLRARMHRPNTLSQQSAAAGGAPHIAHEHSRAASRARGCARLGCRDRCRANLSGKLSQQIAEMGLPQRKGSVINRPLGRAANAPLAPCRADAPGGCNGRPRQDQCAGRTWAACAGGCGLFAGEIDVPRPAILKEDVAQVWANRPVRLERLISLTGMPPLRWLSISWRPSVEKTKRTRNADFQIPLDALIAFRRFD